MNSLEKVSPARRLAICQATAAKIDTATPACSPATHAASVTGTT